MTSKPHVVAILGATGQTGRVVLRHLLAVAQSENLVLQIYIRSSRKLIGLLPGIDSNPHAKLFEGALTDRSLIENCCRGAGTIICTVGENENLMGVRVIQDAADGIINALRTLKEEEEPNWQKPSVYLLSSSTFNPRFAAERPPPVHWLIKTAFRHSYADLVKAQNRLLEETSLLSVVLIQPPLLVEEEGTGHEISTDQVRLACSYEDLGSGMVGIMLGEEYKGISAIGISSKLGDRPLRYAPEMLRRIFWGMIANVRYYFFPCQSCSD